MNNAATATARTASPVRKLTYSALFLALAMVLPFLTGQIPEIGSMLCPMHIPALLCGFMCGWPWGLAVGFISPLLRSMSGMPPIWIAIPMAFEMATYGAIAGLLYRKLPKTGWRIYASLISAMVAGRLVWGLVKFLLAGLQGTEFSLALFLSGAVTTAIPGIILQLILIPILVVVMERTNMALDVRALDKNRKGLGRKRPSPFLYSSALLSSFGALVSIKNAPSGAVMTMPSTATDSTMLPQGSPAASGTEPMAACTVALGR